jgi:hypothetical protein
MAGGLLMGSQPEKFLVPALEEVFRPGGVAFDSPSSGAALANFFVVANSVSERAKVVGQAVNQFRESLGELFSPLYRIDVTIIDEMERKLRVDFEGMISTGQVIAHSFDIALPTAEMFITAARARHAGDVAGRSSLSVPSVKKKRLKSATEKRPPPQIRRKPTPAT